MGRLFAAVVRRRQSTTTAQQAGIGLTACDKKLASYRATLDAGADPTVVTAWITETQRNADASRV
ncbi:hypothetical protein GCM10020358_59490 [Amorphoplanes nipponensis]|uniref:Uncharacterized protein n=1 Tax=Actinoplanes nipponensis TaxID=135950 RepID=A0A919MJR6_9ACTN|nr:hypothetical protein Ani05nite_04610 [Actinoplanes nipponensis]